VYFLRIGVPLENTNVPAQGKQGHPIS